VRRFEAPKKSAWATFLGFLMRLTSSNHRSIVELAPNPLAELAPPAHAPQPERSAEPEPSALPALSRVRLHTLRIGVVGLGYVGLPLAVAFGRRFQTTGHDASAGHIDRLQSGHDPAGEIEPSQLLSAQRLQFTGNPESLSDCEMIFVCVPTPVNEAHQPDFGPLIEMEQERTSDWRHDRYTGTSSGSHQSRGRDRTMLCGN